MNKGNCWDQKKKNLKQINQMLLLLSDTQNFCPFERKKSNFNLFLLNHHQKKNKNVEKHANYPMFGKLDETFGNHHQNIEKERTK